MDEFTLSNSKSESMTSDKLTLPSDSTSNSSHERMMIQNLDKESILGVFLDLETEWLSVKDSPQYMDYGMKCLGVDHEILKSGKLTNDDLYKKLQVVLWKSTEIKLRVNALYEEMDEDELDDLNTRMYRIFEVIYYTYHMIQGLVHIHVCKHPEIDNSCETELSFFRFSCIADCKNNPFQNLILYMLEYMNMRDLRRYKENCMKKVYNKDGLFTYSWKVDQTLVDVVYEACRKETNYEQWQNLTACKDNPTKVAEYIQNCRDPEVPALQKDRNMHSFQNGVYFSMTDAFVTYTSGKINPGNKCSSKFIPYKVDESIINKHWSEINTPHLQGIMDFQEWPEEVQRWLYVFIGRSLYDVGVRDDWQVVMYLVGLAGSGKSTIIGKIISLLYDAEDVGTISTNIEKKFGIEALTEKLIVVAPEIKHDVSIEQADFQSMVSGERVVVNRKNRQPIVVDPWKSHLTMAGNQVPDWSDNSNSIARRVIWFYFSKVVPHDKGDMKLGNKLETELPSIIIKANKAYIEATDMYANNNIWLNLPKYFHDQSNEMAKSCNPLHAFMSECIIMDGDEWVEENAFKAMFKTWCGENSTKNPKWGKELYASLFQKHGLVIETNKKRKVDRVNASGKLVSGSVILGCMFASKKEE